MKKSSEEIREGYRNRLILPEFCEEEITFFTKGGLMVAQNYVRVVIGDRGPYIEFNNSMMGSGIFIPDDQIWRCKNTNCFYIEYRTIDECNVKIYKQKKQVSYADYQIGLWYISPFDLVSDKHPILIRGK